MLNNYSIVRHQKNKMLLKVENGKVLVYAPNWVSESEIDSFVNRHTTWINNRLEKNYHYISLEMVDGNIITLLDHNYHLSLQIASDNSVEIIDDKIVVSATTEKQLKSVYQRYLYNRLDEIVQAIKQKHHFSFYDDFKFYRGKWGCCYPNKNLIILSMYTLCLPIELIDAIVCHEYTHFTYQNHQKEFYQQLYKYCPKYNVLNKKLKEYQIKKK
ncbi:MAG: M48 family metallopeptidase [Erysipelotrichaceae bacterium]